MDWQNFCTLFVSGSRISACWCKLTITLTCIKVGFLCLLPWSDSMALTEWSCKFWNNFLDKNGLSHVIKKSPILERSKTDRRTRHLTCAGQKLIWKIQLSLHFLNKELKITTSNLPIHLPNTPPKKSLTLKASNLLPCHDTFLLVYLFQLWVENHMQGPCVYLQRWNKKAKYCC